MQRHTERVLLDCYVNGRLSVVQFRRGGGCKTVCGFSVVHLCAREGPVSLWICPSSLQNVPCLWSRFRPKVPAALLSAVCTGPSTLTLQPAVVSARDACLRRQRAGRPRLTLVHSATGCPSTEGFSRHSVCTEPLTDRVGVALRFTRFLYVRYLSCSAVLSYGLLLY